LVDEATPTETSATETAAPVDAAPATALGTAAAEGTTADTAAADAPAAEAKTEDTQEGEAAEAAAVVPDKYELVVSEGLTIDPAQLEAATPVFRELGLTNEQANKLMPVAEQFAKSIGDNLNRQILESVAGERKAWLDTAKADPDIGGQNWDASLVTAAKALDGLGFPKGSSFRALLDESGLGNHPDMIRAFVQVGRAIGEDNDFPRGGAATSAPRTAAEILYPSKTGA
jgi:hypothetical protein